MMRSLYSGVSGLKTHQTKMDVIGNNIANVNTVGYKSQNVTFQDVMYQTISFASGPNPNTGRGGINAKQIGLGVTTGAISTTITTAGATQTTNDPFHIRITGDSFFVVNNGTQNFFTKAGNFTIDSAGNLVMSTTGYNVMGWQVVDGEIVKGTVKPLKLMSAENLTSAPEATTKANFSGVVDKENSDVNLNGYASTLEFYDALGYTYKANFSLHNAEGLTDAGGTVLPEGSFYMSLNDIIDGDKASVLASSGATFGNTLNFTDADGNPVTVNNAILVTYNQADGTLSAIDGTAGATTSMLSFGTGPAQQKFSNITVDFSGSQMKGNKGVMSANILKGDANKDGTGRLLGKMIGISISND